VTAEHGNDVRKSGWHRWLAKDDRAIRPESSFIATHHAIQKL